MFSVTKKKFTMNFIKYKQTSKMI